MDLDSRAAEFKVVIMGDSSIGKTSIVQRFNQETFDYQMDTTIGASFLTKVVQTTNGPVTLNVWDTAGQERYRSLIPTYARGANAAIICYDVTVPISFKNVEGWIEELHKFCSEDIPIYIVGNKCDLDSIVPATDAEQLAQKFNCQFMLTSAKKGTGIKELFCDIAEKLVKSSEEPEMTGVDINTETPKKKDKCCK